MRRPLALFLAAALPVIAAYPACGARTGLRVPHDAATDPIAEDAVEEEAAPVDEKPPPPPGPRADKIDLLFVIDGSGSMGDKQDILGAAIPDLVRRLTNPRCVDASGVPIAAQPPSALDECPDGSRREFNPVQNMHLGVISSNLGVHGAANSCSVGFPIAHEDDDAHLLDRGAVGETWQDLGFLAWDPAGEKSPPGLSDPEVLEDTTRRIIGGVGELGCAAEAPLEAFYRFLVDPNPFKTFATGGCPRDPGQRCVTPTGTDEELLKQRADFLRPDSLVAVILLSDENDCSVIDGGDNYRVLEQEPMARATSQCATEPHDRCCRSCADDSIVGIGCPDLATDPECMKGPYGSDEDSFWMRCWDQKRRYGRDYLWPISRYVDGLTKQTVEDRDGDLVPNPLYSDLSGGDFPPRHPSLVFFAALVGVPWQDLARDPFDTNELHYKTAAEMTASDTWDWIIGRPDEDVPPSDPLMLESIAERSGTNPAIGAPLAPSSSNDPLANPINGHEMELSQTFGLQYACIFDLEEPRDCNAGGLICDCRDLQQMGQNPICQAPDGTYGALQYRAKAYPGRRELEVLHGIGDRAIMASICARNMQDDTRQDFGYRPALQAILDRLGEGLF